MQHQGPHVGFIISLAVTLAVVVAGWAYFFTGQMKGLAQVVPQAASGFENITTAAATVGTETAEGMRTATQDSPAFQELKDAVDTTVTFGAVLDEMKTKLETSETLAAPETLDITTNPEPVEEEPEQL